MPVAIITGASTGIGAALAVVLARRGYSVGLVARRGELLEEVAATVRAAGGTAAWAVADVTDRAAVESAFADLTTALGPCDLLVANAGMGIPAPAVKAPVDKWIAMTRLNVEGVLYSVGAVLPGMIERKSGHIAVISSIASMRGLPGFGGYSASKAYVSNFAESLRVELKKRGIAVTTVQPGFIETPLTEKNTFTMPFLLKVDHAATIIADGLAAKKRVLTFPWQMKLVMGLVRLFPPALYDLVMAKIRIG